MTDPADCGPVTLAFCQDVQAEAFDWPAEFFAPKEWHRRRPRPGARELKVAADALARREAPASSSPAAASSTPRRPSALKAFAEKHNVPVGETQAGKSSLPHDHPLNLGSIGVTGSSATNAVAESADVVLAVGTRLQDFTTGSWALFQDPDRRIVAVNVTPYDAHKHNALPLIADAKLALEELSAALGDQRFPDTGALKAEWTAAVDAVTAAPEGNALPTDMQVIGAVNRAVGEDAIVVCAAGGLPGELHKLWRAARPNGYHLEYGFSTMGYEIAGGLGVKMAHPDREVVVMLGDGSYMMMNSELATSVMLGRKLIVVLLDNRGFGCINRLQLATGGASFNNLLDTARHAVPSAIDFAAHAAAMGATAEKVDGIAGLEAAMKPGPRQRQAATSSSSTPTRWRRPRPAAPGGTSPSPRSPTRETVRAARKDYEARRELQRLVD